jgi:hypothetical protein
MPRQRRPPPDLAIEPREQISEGDLRFFIDLAIREAALAEQLKAALERGDDDAALAVARQMVGLEEAA